ncbi:hypothetical protein, partial [Pseudogemmobacter sonorensis]|uniref:hypothetical protein n=1 Tax=Pseudogemmobacter sonorensis TaxID=2989681 RepID=UPI00367C9D4C
EHMRDGMQRYIDRGINPGSFMTAVLSNDLMEAVRRGDDQNRTRLHDYVIFLYNEAPAWCFGSPRNVEAWIAKGGLLGGADTEAAA